MIDVALSWIFHLISCSISFSPVRVSYSQSGPLFNSALKLTLLDSGMFEAVRWNFVFAVGSF